jgi:peptidoglycan/xylan/chitin deacetylase (PgdA/CDA1 family)
MRNAWYVLLYHNVSWEENPYTRGLSVTVPPDLLREHLAQASRHGEVVSIAEGLQRSSNSGFPRPTFSFWFDDGFAGVRQYASPLLERYDAPGALSVCSRFVSRQELFWRSKLSYMNYRDGLIQFRLQLRERGQSPNGSVKDHVLDHFSESMLDALDLSYRELTSERERNDAFRLFDTADALVQLRAKGWLIANHSAAHYPIGEDSCRDRFAAQFGECELAFQDLFGEPSTCWVLPFDRELKRTTDVVPLMNQHGGGRYLGLVGNRFNTPATLSRKVLYRIGVPLCTGGELVKLLARIGS